ncbi:MAG: site-specific DNA-methyltransferase [Candidatus Edwardsbacteria bacterium]|nr:site-specific DNA-methyltransferase [Candidatus Edwardsbacteria bacterium]MBU1577065.1 site-specific DNA-methyltransferase [Candidatus Edwardsbacteria bacterium]MBU2594733.1 site-specific DNA-methyltransferase [Candidatus Edwardsbacteria bacterium]
MKKVKGTETSAFGTSGRINHDSSKFYNSKMYENLNDKKIDDIVDREFPKEYENSIILGNSENMKELPNNSVHLMITSPPYNASKEYDQDLTLKEYLSLLKNVFTDTYRVLVNGGRACVNVANLGRKPYIPLSHYVSKIMMDIGYSMRGEIIWNKGSSASPSTAWGSWLSAANPILRDVHEYILVFSKGSYNRLKEHRENTITKEQFMECTFSVWNMNAVSARSIGHPAPFPLELPDRLIKLYSFKDDIILDPFVGSGQTAIAALKNERKYVGYDISKEYIKLAESRIDKYKNQITMNFDKKVKVQTKKETKVAMVNTRHKSQTIIIK